ncbi:DsbA family protein [Chryseomicrobium sp. FSL W7-1435]|uniref:DsbA family protein n=1 Tax=Chryseomicrobium sp. FSL W7-1435 TaxID=2921704 RepID=UPI00315A7B4E
MTKSQPDFEHTATSCIQRPLEIYAFLDPLCPDSWRFQMTVKRLQIDYGHYFTLRVILSTSLANLNNGGACSAPIGADQTIMEIEHPVLPSIAVKAAEFQGKRVANRFLSNLQEAYFVYRQNVNSLTTLKGIAQDSAIDVKEFLQDIRSSECAKSFQSDLSISCEMEIDQFPSIVVFNENIEDEGIKIAGTYSYEIYEHILSELVGVAVEKQAPPEVEDLLDQFTSLSSKEIAMYYNMHEKQVEYEMKKKYLQREVDRVVVGGITKWKSMK